jgi:exo-1,4-beta-D-glucosaminidase
MFEAFGRNKYASTGVIQWMLNSAWPSMLWHLYDYYLRPSGSYFGTKKACEPLHVQYSYDDASIVVVNSFYKAFTGMKVQAKVYNLDMAEKYSKQAVLDVPSDSATRLFTIPEITGLSTTYFVHLRLEDREGRLVSSNFYWLSTKPDVLDWDKSTWYRTPTKSFSDLRALAGLPLVGLNVSATSEAQGPDGVTRVRLENPSQTLAFCVHLRVMKAAGTPEESEVLPVLWQDNYFALLPGEKRDVSASYGTTDAGKLPVSVRVDGWNVKPWQL